MDREGLQKRMKLFAIRIIKMIENMLETKTTKIIGNQLVRSATSMGANYITCGKARSAKEFH
jgi:four helix bundle protein